jgi:hypothetical protein
VNISKGGFSAVPPRAAQSIGVEVQGGRAVVLIAAGALLPAARAMTFTTVSDRQRAIEVRVVRCGAEARPFGVVGRFLLPGLREGLRGEARIDIGLSLDSEGVLRAWAADRSCGARQEASFAGLWALEPDRRPDAIAALARRVDAGIARFDDRNQGTLRAQNDETERWALEGELIHAADYATALATMAGEIDARLNDRGTPRKAAFPVLSSRRPFRPRE